MKTGSDNVAEVSATGALAGLSAAEMLEGFRSKSFDPVDVVEDTIAMLSAADAACNIMVSDLFESARKQAQESAAAWNEGTARPMEGVPVSIKDLVFVEGAPCKGGAPSLANYVAETDAHVVTKLREAGAVLTCKTTTCESGYKLTADSPVTGITRNPWDTNRTSGGSSGGAAAGVAAGAGPIAIGTDGVGSIRVPSSFCGVVGLKPTFGYVSRAPGFFPPSWGSLAHTGPIARTVSDIATTLEMISGYDMRDAASLFGAPDVEASEKPLRIAVSADLGYTPVDPAVRQAFEDACAAILSGPFDLSAAKLELASDVFESVLKPIAYSEQAGSVGTRGDSDFAGSDPEFRAVIDEGRKFSGVDYVEATHRRSKLRGQYVQLFQNADVLLTPTLPVTAFAAGTLGVSEIDGQAVDGHLGWSPFTWPINLTGLPAATVPCGFCPEGLPIGLQIIAPWGREDLVLKIASYFESVKPWLGVRPSLS